MRDREKKTPDKHTTRGRHTGKIDSEIMKKTDKKHIN